MFDYFELRVRRAWGGGGVGGRGGENNIVARFAQQATLEHQMRPLVAVQIIITAPHGNTRGPAGVKVGFRVCVSGREGTRTLTHSRILCSDSV